MFVVFSQVAIEVGTQLHNNNTHMYVHEHTMS